MTLVPSSFPEQSQLENCRSERMGSGVWANRLILGGCIFPAFFLFLSACCAGIPQQKPHNLFTKIEGITHQDLQTLPRMVKLRSIHSHLSTCRMIFSGKSIDLRFEIWDLKKATPPIDPGAGDEDWELFSLHGWIRRPKTKLLDRFWIDSIATLIYIFNHLYMYRLCRQSKSRSSCAKSLLRSRNW